MILPSDRLIFALLAIEIPFEWSADRLTRSADSLASIAYEAGFADQSHFTRAFKRYAGLLQKSW